MKLKHITMEILFMEILFSENLIYFTFNNVDGYIIEGNSIDGNSIEESDNDKYLILASTSKNKKVLKKYTEVWDEIKNLIETINSGKQLNMKNIALRLSLSQMMICLWIKY